ncbi:MAG: hypothetical protein IKF72_09820 [Kiritimatiellae bacterium]|nr:hypothetical protein [Kiritimatiellia bacterium]
MDLTLTPSGGSATTLCSDAARSVDGAPVGPGNLSFVEAPGVEVREYVGADRILPENVRCNHGTITFQATRVYATAALAAAYALAGHLSEPVEGVLKYGTTEIFAHACVTSRRIGMVGCTVVVNYTIEG